MIRNEYAQIPLTDRKDRNLEISSVVIHYISARYTNPQEPFLPENSIAILRKFHLSYHYIISRDGLVIQLVPESDQAYHAGRGNLFGRYHPNGYSIGIALIGTRSSGFTRPQMEELIKLVCKQREDYKIPLNQIVGHEHVSWNRKTPKKDPGPKFDWIDFLDRLPISKGIQNG